MPSRGAPELSIVVPVYNNWWLTERCLRTLDGLREGCLLAFETIVVDNASNDETPHAIAEFAWTRFVRHEQNRNFAGACNAGAREAQAPLTLFLNNDAYPLGDAVTPLARAFDRAEVAIAGGALFFEDGVTQAAGLIVLQNAHWHYCGRNLPSNLDEVTRSRDALGVSGAAMAVRTQWFIDAGGFDETFVNGFEDVDLCMRARLQRRAIAYVAQARFAHYEAASAGRFDREVQNERRFYQRWASQMASLPRTARGNVEAIAVQAAEDDDPLLRAARDDLEQALRQFGHPVVRGTVPAWRRFDARFRRVANVAWFHNDVARPGITITCRGGAPAAIRTRGAMSLEVPWLPCAASARIDTLSLRRSDDAACRDVGVAGDDPELEAAIAARGYSTLRVTPAMLVGGQSPRELACVVHARLTDPSGFGTVLLAQSGIPSIVLARDDLRALFAGDVAVVRERDAIPDAVTAMAHDATLRAAYGSRLAADARRRFSPRRSAIRVVDLLCAARFGLERPARARSNTPL
jgi:GT2 family glycosyltransferase